MDSNGKDAWSKDQTLEKAFDSSIWTVKGSAKLSYDASRTVIINICWREHHLINTIAKDATFLYTIAINKNRKPPIPFRKPKTV